MTRQAAAGGLRLRAATAAALAAFAIAAPAGAGYRTVEGGANVEETYNFAWLHYAVASVRWRM